MILQKVVGGDKYYNECLHIMNTVLKLTTTEINVLSEFLKLKESFNNFPEDERNKLTFSSTSRQLVCEKLDISKYNLNNYIKGLKRKNMIIDLGRGNYKLNPYIELDSKQEFELTFKIKSQ